MSCAKCGKGTYEHGYILFFRIQGKIAMFDFCQACRDEIRARKKEKNHARIHRNYQEV